MSKCVAIMLAHAGFESIRTFLLFFIKNISVFIYILATHQSVLDLLTDVLEAFLQKLSYQLYCANDDEENGCFDFPVIIWSYIFFMLIFFVFRIQ